VRYADFETVTRRLTPGTIISATALPGHALLLFGDAWNGKPIRLVGVGVSNFIPEQPDQLRLFEQNAIEPPALGVGGSIASC
jgi:hypothetical protein